MIGETITATVVGESTALALPDDAAVLDAVSDPGAFCLAALGRAKAWLQQATATDLPEVMEVKARAEAIRTYVAQKELGKDAELSAAEIVRRAERRIAELIRQGQAEGTITEQHRHPDGTNSAIKLRDIIPKHEWRGNGAGIRDLADDVTSEQFEEGLAEAKGEKNLSRANVVRKVQKAAGKESTDARAATAKRMAAEGHTSRQIGEALGIKNMGPFRHRHGIDVPADAVVGKSRIHNADRIVGESVEMLAGIVHGLSLVGNPRDADLDPSKVDDWSTSLADSLRLLNRFTKQLKEMTQ